MAGPALSAHVFLVCRSVSWDGPAAAGTSRTLEQVAYAYGPETPDGYPYETEFWLFARLASNRRREFTSQLHLSLVWHDDPGLRPELWSRPFYTSVFRPAAPVRDVAVSVPVVFEGPGLFEFQLWYPVVRRWDGARRRRLLARAHILMES